MKTIKTFFTFLTLFIVGIVSGYAQDITLGVTSYRIDTLAHNKVGPGTYYTALDLVSTNGVNPLKVFFLQVDATNPYIKFNAVLSHDSIGGNERTSAMALRRSEENSLYFAGTNGDFYTTTAPVGIPLHGHVDNGNIGVRPTPSYHVVMDNMNKPYIDIPGFSGNVSNGTLNYSVTNMNATRNADNLIIYTTLMGNYTRTNDYGTEVLVQLDSPWQINAPVTGKIIEKYENKGNNRIQPGTFVISGHGLAQQFVNQLQIGEDVTINVNIQLQNYNVAPNITSLIGGDRIILQNGLVTENDWTDRHPRTTIGYTQDNSKVIFCVVDGRSTTSVGVSTKMLGQIMQWAGAHTAMNLDGGGSSTMYVNKLGVMNNTSDGNERANANGFFAISTSPTDNVVAEIRNIKEKVRLPRYGVYTPQFYGYNQYDVLIETNLQGVQMVVDPSIGEILADGRFYASGTENGAITATYNGLSAFILVEQTPDAPIKIRLDSVLLDNETPYEIELQTTVEGTTMDLNPSALNWTVENPSVVEVTEGVVKGLSNGSSLVIGTLGDFKDTLKVNIEISPEPTLLAKSFADGWTITASSNLTNVSHVPTENGVTTTYTYAAGRNTNISYNQNFAFYSLPDTFKIVFNPGNTNLSKLVMRLKENNGGITVINKEFTGFTLNSDNVLSLPLDQLMDNPEDRGAYPLWFNFMQFVLNPTGMVAGQEYTIDIKQFDLIYKDVTVSIEDVEQLSRLRVYPNPVTNGRARIALGIDKSEAVKVEVYGLGGQLYKVETYGNVTSNEIELPLGGLTSGVYFIKVHYGTETETFKIIIQ